jgi:hypothetical protein
MIKHSQDIAAISAPFSSYVLVSIFDAQLFAKMTKKVRVRAGIEASMLLMWQRYFDFCNSCNAAATVRRAYIDRLNIRNCCSIFRNATLQQLQHQSLASYMRPRARNSGAYPSASCTRATLQLLQRCIFINIPMITYIYIWQQCCNDASATIGYRCENEIVSLISTGCALVYLKIAIKYGRIPHGVWA